MINMKNYEIIETEGYESRDEAYQVIRKWYSLIKGVTTYYDEGKWYIVRSKYTYLNE